MTSAADGDDFYVKLGKFFCSPAVIKELGGYPIYDTTNHIWFVALHNNTAIGFGSLKIVKGVASLCDAYVEPDWRNTGVYQQLIQVRIQHAKAMGAAAIKTTAMKISKPILVKYGFKITRSTSNYFFLEKSLNQ